MNSRASSCRSDSKPRIPVSVNRASAARYSLQNENAGVKRQRSSSLDFRARGSGSACKPRSSSEERKSELFGRNSSRKSSLNLDSGKALKEFRPLNDKNYQKKKLNELIQFLQECECTYPVSLAKLMQPSKKDFEVIFQFLIRFFDPFFETKKLEEDGPKILKTMCYPFIPNKSAFTYIARTNWPPMLGVLLYLMDNLKYMFNVDENLLFHNPQLERPDEHALLLEYIFQSYIDRNDDEEEEKEIFTKIIKARMPYDIGQLESRRDELKLDLEELQNNVDNINALKDTSQQLDSEIQQYEAFIESMKEHRKKKEDICQKISEEVTQKESELQVFHNTLNNKLAVYDAQGYDGKKQLSYFENQKKELMEKLESKKNVYRELQGECGELEIQHRQALDNGMSTCDAFNQLYSSIAESASGALDPLRVLGDPKIRGLCTNFNFDFPNCRMHPNQKCVLQWSNTRKTSVEEVKQKIDSANLIFKGLDATQNQKLHVVKMKKSEVAVNLKMAASEETQIEQDLNSKEKQALEEMKTLETECSEMIKILDTLQGNIRESEEGSNTLKERLNTLEKVEKEKQRMLSDYLLEQKKLFSGWLKDIEETNKLVQDTGEEIFEAVQKAILKKQ